MSDETLGAALREARRAAVDLARHSGKLAKLLLARAERAAKDPRGSVARATRAAVMELDAATREIDRLLKKL